MSLSTSPFKFLDSYQQEDEEIFFGRKQETETLYDALSGVKHLLVYGPSGAGKTSLIECGLRNQFSDADWFALSIRRGKDMIASTYGRINEALKKKIELNSVSGLPVDPSIGFEQAIQHLFAHRFQPVYLLFDQFEELLISGRENEKKEFFKRIDQLIRYKVPCRVIFIMREEFIGHLSEFEHLCPSIFEHRFRLEKMTRAKVQGVIQSILDAEYYEDSFEVDQPAKLAQKILSKLPDDRKEIDLSHVQVFLSELWDRATSEKYSADNLPSLGQHLIKEGDNLTGVLDSFLKKQLKELESEYGEKLPLELLAVMISERFTKLQLDAGSLQEELLQRKVESTQALAPLLLELEKRRIVRKIRSGDQIQYEISHDTLAQVIGQNLTEEMQLRRKAEDIYKVYEEREGYFTREDLDFIRPYREYLAYPAELARRIQESEAYLVEQEEERIRLAEAQAKEERRLKEEAVRSADIAAKNEQVAKANAERATQRTWIAAVVAVIALIAALGAYKFNQDAQQEAESARKAQARSDSLLVITEIQNTELAASKARVQATLDSLQLSKEATVLAENERDEKEVERSRADSLRREEVIKNISSYTEKLWRIIKDGNDTTARKIFNELEPLARNYPDIIAIGDTLKKLEQKNNRNQ